MKFYLLLVACLLCSIQANYAQVNQILSYQTSTHHAPVNDVIFVAKGGNFYTSGNDKKIIRWNVGEEIVKLEEINFNNKVGQQNMVRHIAQLNENTLVAVGSFEEDNQALMIVLDKAGIIKETVKLPHGDIPNTLQCFEDNIWIGFGNSVVNIVMDKSGTIQQQMEYTFGMNARRVVFGNYNKFIVLDDTEKHTLYQIKDAKTSANELKVNNHHQLRISAADFAEDGSYVTASIDGSIHLYNPKGKHIRKVGALSNEINQVEITPDGKFVLVFERSTGIGFIYSATGDLIETFEAHDNTVTAVDISINQDGEYLVVSAGGNSSQVILWSLLTGKVIDQKKSEGAIIWNLALQAEPKHLLIASHDDADHFRYDLDLNKLVIQNITRDHLKIEDTIPKHWRKVDDYSIKLNNGIFIKNDPKIDGRMHKVMAIDDHWVIGSDFSLKVYNAFGSVDAVLEAHYGAVRALTFDPQQQYLYTAGDDQQILVWDWEHLLSSPKPSFSIFVDESNEFIMSSSEGYFGASQNGASFANWIVSKEAYVLGDRYQAEQYFNILYRPEDVRNGYFFKDPVSDLVKAKGERVFDLTKVNKPSVAIFQTPYAQDQNSQIYLAKENGTYEVEDYPKVFLDLDIYDGGGGIKEVRIYHNEKLIVSDEKFDPEKNRFDRQYEVSLMPGVNDFSVKVKNFQEIESNLKLDLKIQYNGKASAASDLYVFAIGINEYQNPTYTLNYAEPDARAFVNQIKKTSEGIFDDINLHFLFNENGTRENIIKTFEEIASKANLQDVFIFYYAGHGVMAKIDDEHEEYFLVTTDVTQMYGGYSELQQKGFSATMLKQYAAKIKAQKQLVLLDACNSGGAVVAMARRGAAEEKAIFQLARSTGSVLISASGTQQFATEFEHLGHGAFTYVLLEALKGKADGGDKDKKITVNELKAYMEDMVPQITLQYGNQAQYPTGFSTGQDFPIGVVK